MDYFVIDKIHLVYERGPEFWPVYATLAIMRACLPKWTVCVGLIAMLEHGLKTETVIQSAKILQPNIWII